MDKSIAELNRIVRQAFSGTTYPGDDGLVSHDCWECREVSELFRGTQWEKWIGLQFDQLMIPLLSPSAFKYYLPAFLINALTNPSTSGIDTVVGLLQPANPPSDRKLQHYKADRLAALSEKERAAVRAVLNHVKTQDTFRASDIDRALDSMR